MICNLKYDYIEEDNNTVENVKKIELYYNPNYILVEDKTKEITNYPENINNTWNGYETTNT